MTTLLKLALTVVRVSYAPRLESPCKSRAFFFCAGAQMGKNSDLVTF